MDKEKEARRLLSQLSLEEKASLCSGEDTWHTKAIPRLDIPSVFFSDGPHGLRKQVNTGDNLGIGASVPATCFPAAALTACSFDRKLLHEMGNAIAEECQSEGVDIILGPGINMKRSPLCGRNFEYFSEDPYLSGELGTAYVEGVQEEGVGVSLKHFAANNQETRRMTVSSIIDERTLWEIYLRAFQKTVKKSRPYTIMSSYNRLNGKYVGESRELLTEILRKRWGYDGLVVSDWGAVYRRVNSLKAGLDLEMPGCGGINDRKIVQAVESGVLSEEELDQAVLRILRLILKTKENRRNFGNPSVEKQKDHHALAIRLAEESMVLLKNEKDILPLQKGQRILVLGDFAKSPRFQGAGSSKITPHFIDSPLDCLTKEGLTVEYMDSNSVTEEACQRADAVLVFAGLPEGYETEGVDRKHMGLPIAQNQLIDRVSQWQDRVAVILMCGSPVELPWIEKVQGLLLAYLGGEGAGAAIAGILTGRVSPSGRLTETWPLRLEDNPSYGNFPGERNLVRYEEGILTGYRYYGTKNIDVLFPFGYGLSYSSFEYSHFEIQEKQVSYGDTLHLHFQLTNTGKWKAKEASLVYFSHASEIVPFPAYQLVGFCKTELDPGESKLITLEVDTNDLAFYNPAEGDFVLEPGEYQLHLGNPPGDENTPTVSFFVRGEPVYYEPAKLPEMEDQPKESMGWTSCLEDGENTAAGRLVLWIVKHVMHIICRREPEQEGMMLATAREMPFFAVYTSAAGKISEKTMRRLITFLNGHPLKAIVSPEKFEE